MTKEEIRTKWIRHTPLLKLDECVDNAMDEYAYQLEVDNANEILKLRIQKRDCLGSYQKLKSIADAMANDLEHSPQIVSLALDKYKEFLNIK